MTNRWCARLVAAGLAVLTLGFETNRAAVHAASESSSSSGPQAVRALPGHGLPLAFEENRGQTDACVRFTARANGLTAFLMPSQAVLAVRGGNPDDGMETDFLRMAFVGAEPEPRVEDRDALPGRCNYFLGSDPSAWVTEVPTCARVVVLGVYPGIDVHWRGDAGGILAYDLVVSPGADPAAVAFTLEGTHDVAVESDGALRATTRLGVLRQSRPVAHQMIDGVRTPVDASFLVTSAGHVRFALGAFDAERPLVIDPSLTFSTYLGGGATDVAHSIAVDANGATYVAGQTSSTNFPTLSPYQSTHGGGTGSVPLDAFVTKINAAGSATVFSTYLGGSATDQAYGIAVDGAGAVHIMGGTYSANFPTQSPLQGSSGGAIDAFVAKLTSSGSGLVYSTYLGGSSSDFGWGVCVDAAGATCVTGITLSTDFPTLSPLQSVSAGGNDAFVAKLNPAGSALVYSTYLGGSGNDHGRSIAIDATGAAYVSGSTESTNFPMQSALQTSIGGTSDGFVTKINASGSALVYSTYLGGSSGDSASSIAVDASGAAYVCGGTSSTDFPTLAPFQSTLNGVADGFVTKIGASGSALAYSTYLGGFESGSSTDYLYGIAVDSGGAATVVGGTISTDFPTLAPSQASYGGGALDAIVAKFDPAGSALVFSTYLGGSGFDYARGVAVDPTGAAYVAGYTWSTDFPQQGALQTTFGGGNDAFVAKYPLSVTGGPPPAVPDPPSGLVANYSEADGVSLSWTDNADDETGFRIERRPAAYSFALLATTSADVTSAIDAALYPTTTYTYRVRAFSANGPSAWSNEATVTTSAGAPTPVPVLVAIHLVADVLDETSIGLSWTDNSTDEVLFGVERAVGGDAFRSVASLPTDVSGYADYDLHPGWPCTYRVRALSLRGPSSFSNPATATLPATLDVAMKSGSLTDSPKPKKDKLKLSATYTSSAPLDPVANGLELQLGATNAPLLVSIAPSDAGWKPKPKKGVPTKSAWKSAKGVTPRVTIVFDLAKHTLTATVTGADFTAAPSSLVRLLVASGADGGGHAASWTESKPGRLRFE